MILPKVQPSIYLAIVACQIAHKSARSEFQICSLLHLRPLGATETSNAAPVFCFEVPHAVQ